MDPSQNWELSQYQLHRTPQETINDETEIAVLARDLQNEFTCPICLDLLKNTFTTKECLHRFCADCIVTALRSGNKECPTCRKKLASKRCLRPDPNFDLLLSKIFPSRDDYEALQERAIAKLNRSLSQAAFVTSMNDGIQIQAQARTRRMSLDGRKATLVCGENSMSSTDTNLLSVGSIQSKGVKMPAQVRSSLKRMSLDGIKTGLVYNENSMNNNNTNPPLVGSAHSKGVKLLATNSLSLKRKGIDGTKTGQVCVAESAMNSFSKNPPSVGSTTLQGVKLQTQNRTHKKMSIDETITGQPFNEDSMSNTNTNPPSERSTPLPVPAPVNIIMPTNIAQNKRTNSIQASERTEESVTRETRIEANLPLPSLESAAEEHASGREVELIIKPHPTKMAAAILKLLGKHSIRYLKTSVDATVAHLSKYLPMRDAQLLKAYRVTLRIYISAPQGRYVCLNGGQTLQSITEKYFKGDKSLVLFYSWKKTK